MNEHGLGIVGFGRCGQLAARVLEDRFRVCAADLSDRSAEARSLGVEWGSVSEAAAAPRVVLAVPIRKLPEALDAIAPRLNPGALVVDVCSVKLEPRRWMRERLPGTVHPVGTHPLFGPDSVREEGLAGQRIAICPAPGHEQAADDVAVVCRELGIAPFFVAADEHDRRMARSQAMVFLVARSLRRAGIAAEDAPNHRRLVELGTPSERRFLSVLELVSADTEELYEDIIRHNPHAHQAARRLAEAVEQEIDRLLS
ncbi:MAG TPA: prephenate dehydrogenase [Gemmatimonadota bacterium]|nr:prephenate dehydrogenase [Gemmatimonadota bacterium]